jgi:hypothetical protein
MQDPFFSGILVLFIPFHLGILQRLSIQSRLCIGLQHMSQFEKIPPTATRFPSQLRGRYPLSESPYDEDDLRRTVVSALERGSCPGIEDPPTGAATIVEDGFPEIAVDVKTLLSLTPRTTKSLGMEQIKEVVEAGILIHQLVNREVHGSISSG